MGAGWPCSRPATGGAATSACGPSPRSAACCPSGPLTSLHRREPSAGSPCRRRTPPTTPGSSGGSRPRSPPPASTKRPGTGGRARERAARLAREADRIERRVKGRSESLARQFDRVLGVLQAWGYVDGWSLTAAGSRLSRIYHEADLLVAETMERGLFDGLRPEELAGLVSVFTFEARRSGEVAAVLPTPLLLERWAAVERLAAELHAAEDRGALPLTRHPDPGFVATAHRWAAGGDLSGILQDDEISGG
ncbi:MAG: hypothetical protein ACYCUG_13345, partial [Acidimicrobiales bacterium]